MTPLAKLLSTGVVWRAAPEASQVHQVAAISVCRAGWESAQRNSSLAVEGAVEGAGERKHPLRSGISFGIPEIDKHFLSENTAHRANSFSGAVFPPGTLHEWAICGSVQEARIERETYSNRSELLHDKKRVRQSHPSGPLQNIAPLSLLAALSGSALAVRGKTRGKTTNRKTQGSIILWIGRESWPTPFALTSAIYSTVIAPLSAKGFLREPKEREAWVLNLLEQNIFLDPPDNAARLWAIETALRSESVILVVSTLQQLSLRVGRRLVFAARHGGGIGFLVRPPQELRAPSASLSKWLVAPDTASHATCVATANTARSALAPCWHLTLLKYKGKHLPVNEWQLQSSYGTHGAATEEAVSLRLLPRVGNRSVPKGVVQEGWRAG